MASPRRRLGYVAALDGVRGIAIALVVAFHYFGLAGGEYGVDVFFVLSGFLITTLLLEERDATGRISLTAFYSRRARRLLPALAAFLAAYLALAELKGQDGLRSVAVAGLYDANIAQAFFHAVTGHGLEHLWSLAEEEQFYAVWPLVFLLAMRARKPMRWIMAVVIAIATARAGVVLTHAVSHDHVTYGPDMRADPLLVGCLLALGLRRGFNARAWMVAACVAAAVAGFFAPWPQQALELPLVEVAAAILIAVAVDGGSLAKFLAVKPLVFLGQISYSLYLWHFVVPWAVGVTGVAALCFAIPAALASHWLIETPFRRRRVGDNAGESSVDDLSVAAATTG